jgi:hypothetical protein
MLRRLAMMMALFPQGLAAEPAPRAGEVYEISRVSDATFSEGGSSGNSHDQDMWVERVIAVRDEGVEVEIDLPANATAQERAASWQFPVRVLRPVQGPPRLLNRAELETRIEHWLRAAHMTRANCGHWIFTWNAFQIQCDPDQVLELLATLDLTAPDLRDGAAYPDPMALAPGRLRQETHGPDNAVFVAEMALDPEKLRREQSRADTAMTEIVGDPPDMRAIRAGLVPRQFSGTIRLRLEVNAARRTLARTRVITLDTERVNGSREHRIVTETVERRPSPR